MLREQWVDIENYDGYQVSTYGRVKSLDRTVVRSDGELRRFKGKILQPHDNSRGYLQLNLNGHKQQKIHRLVAKAFIPNPEIKYAVNHIDGDKYNNTINNLEWCTRSENEQHAYLHKLKSAPWKGKTGNKHPLSRKVAQIKNRAVVATFAGTNEAHRLTGITQSNISGACTGKRKQAGGFQWRYA